MVALLKSVRYDETVTLVLQKRNMRSIYIYIYMLVSHNYQNGGWF
jgi:hypothetical protein